MKIDENVESFRKLIGYTLLAICPTLFYCLTMAVAFPINQTRNMMLWNGLGGFYLIPILHFGTCAIGLSIVGKKSDNIWGFLIGLSLICYVIGFWFAPNVEG